MNRKDIFLVEKKVAIISKTPIFWVETPKIHLQVNIPKFMLVFSIIASVALGSRGSPSDHLDVYCERLRLGPEDLWDFILGENGEFNTNVQG